MLICILNGSSHQKEEMELGKENEALKKLNGENKKLDFVGSLKASFSGRKFRSGAYATVLSVVVIVIVSIVNLIVTKMNIQFDLSQNSMYSLSDETKQYVAGLKDDITIYYVVQSGNETEIFDKIAQKYDDLSDKITLEHKDPVLYPNFAKDYVTEDVAANSFIVVNNTTGKAKYVDSNDLLVQEINYQTYQTETTGIDVEGKLTSALLNVTTDQLPVVYVTEGHGEAELGDSFNSALDKMNVQVETLKTATVENIPEDCNILFINSPEKDLSDAETTMIKNYMAAGGKAVVTLDYNGTDLANFSSILDYYGIKMNSGIVLEGDSNMYEANYPNYLIPSIESHDITSKASSAGIPVYLPISSGLTISDSIRNSLTVTPLLTTSADSYSKTNIESTTLEKEKGDVDGPFYLGVVATDTYNDITSDLVVYSSEYTFTEDTANYGNASLLIGTVGYLINDSSIVSIPTKSLQEAQIYPSQLQSIVWGLVTVILIPVVIFVTGSVICLRRRKK
jgi:ABC-2 type transport system permease protein